MPAATQCRRNAPAPWLYLFGVIAWTWCWLGAAALTGRPLFGFPVVLLAVIGGLGPVAVSAALVAAGRWDPALDRSAGAFLRRSFNLRALPRRWALAAVLLALMLAFAPPLVDAAFGAPLSAPAGPAVFLFIGMLFGALEEPGWRGYAQEGLQRRMPAAAAAFVVGAFWAAWHLPLFFIEGTYQHGLGVGTPAFWRFHLAILLGSPVYAWLYNVSGRAIAAHLLYHALANAFREAAPESTPAAALGVEAVLAAAVLLFAWPMMRSTRRA